MTTRRVLLVDDEPALRLALRKWFERDGWTVDEAADGRSALVHLEAVEAAYDLVICDVHLPDTNGLDIAARVATRWPSLLPRFVFTTGDLLDFTPAQGTLRERTHVLLKPFDFGDLRTLARALAPADPAAVTPTGRG
jgi:CheY-like chemotaxis protein